MPRIYACPAVLIFVFSLATMGEAAGPKFRWILAKEGGQQILKGMNWSAGDDSIDTSFKITCVGGKLKMGIGADASVGKGEHEPVAVNAISGRTVIKINGTSEKSTSWQMTGSNELVKMIEPDEPLVKLMRTGSNVTFREASGKKFSIPTNGFGSKVEKFFKSCV
jgi:hypothetical protein